MIALLFTLLVSSAFAYDVRICGQWTPDFRDALYDDSDGEDANGDGIVDNDISDRLNTNDPLPAHGILVTVETLDLSTLVWSSIDSGHLHVGGSNAGCTPLLSVTPPTPNGSVWVRLKAMTLSMGDGHLSAVRGDDVTNEYGTIYSSANMVTAATGDRVDVDFGWGDARMDVAIMMALALDREDGGGPPMTLIAYTCPNPNGGADCLGPSASGGAYKHSTIPPSIYVGDASSASTVFHELGHAVAANVMPNASDPWLTTYDWTNHPVDLGAGVAIPADSECDLETITPGAIVRGHSRNSDEATSAAISEGIADYYWAQSINRVDQSDCFVRGGTYDWDHNGTDESNKWYSCELRPLPGLTVADEDYWDDQCFQTSSPLELSVSTEYDWLRGFWDLDTDDGWTYSDLVAVFGFSDPHSWFEEPKVAACVGNCPYQRMQGGSMLVDPTLGLWLDWMAQCVNGICR